MEVSRAVRETTSHRVAAQATSGNTGIALAMVARLQERSAASYGVLEGHQDLSGQSQFKIPSGLHD